MLWWRIELFEYFLLFIILFMLFMIYTWWRCQKWAGCAVCCLKERKKFDGIPQIWVGLFQDAPQKLVDELPVSVSMSLPGFFSHFLIISHFVSPAGIGIMVEVDCASIFQSSQWCTSPCNDTTERFTVHVCLTAKQSYLWPRWGPAQKFW